MLNVTQLMGARVQSQVICSRMWACPHIWVKMLVHQPAPERERGDRTSRPHRVDGERQWRSRLPLPPTSAAELTRPPPPGPSQRAGPFRGPGSLSFCGVGVGAPWEHPGLPLLPELQPCSGNPSFQLPTGAPAHTRNSVDSSQEEPGC